MAIFVISDTHFCHNKDFIYKLRGFNNYQEHDEAIVRNWNSVVGPNDDIYHLGDVFMGPRAENALKIIEQLNGKIHLMRGNHDADNKVKELLKLPNIVEVLYGKTIHIGRYKYFLAHFAAITGDPRSGMPRTISLHGHTHSPDPFEFVEFCSYNVAVDAHNMTPVNIETVRPAMIKELEKRNMLGNSQARKE